jgi:hypothetical protein
MVQCKTNPARDEKNVGMLQLQHTLGTAKVLKKQEFLAPPSHFWNTVCKLSAGGPKVNAGNLRLNHTLYDYLNIAGPGCFQVGE